MKDVWAGREAEGQSKLMNCAQSKLHFCRIEICKIQKLNPKRTQDAYFQRIDLLNSRL